MVQEKVIEKVIAQYVTKSSGTLPRNQVM